MKNGFAFRALIDAGADVNVANNHGMTPLFLVSEVGQAKLLVQHGARLDVTDAGGDTPLMHHLDSPDEILVYLLKAGADVNAVGSGGETALDKAELYGYPTAETILRKYGGETASEVPR